jgi:hypothetical protein
MDAYMPYIGAVGCCVIPLLWTAAIFALGVWYERNGGLPWEIRRRERLEE